MMGYKLAGLFFFWHALYSILVVFLYYYFLRFLVAKAGISYYARDAIFPFRSSGLCNWCGCTVLLRSHSELETQASMDIIHSQEYVEYDGCSAFHE